MVDNLGLCVQTILIRGLLITAVCRTPPSLHLSLRKTLTAIVHTMQEYTIILKYTDLLLLLHHHHLLLLLLLHHLLLLLWHYSPWWALGCSKLFSSVFGPANFFYSSTCQCSLDLPQLTQAISTQVFLQAESLPV